MIYVGINLLTARKLLFGLLINLDLFSEEQFHNFHIKNISFIVQIGHKIF